MLPQFLSTYAFYTEDLLAVFNLGYGVCVSILVCFVPVVFPCPGMVFSIPVRFPRVFFVAATVCFVPGSSVKVLLVPAILCAGWLLTVR